MPQSTLVNTNMIFLSIHFNKIETIHPKAFWSSSLDNTTSHTRLEHLYIDNNNINYIESGTFDPLINLTGIYIQNNKITNIEKKLFINIPKIKYIDISNNTLTNLPTRWLPSTLFIIAIANNDIERLTRETFQGAINLVKLWLSPHNITIDYNTFTNFSKLNYIDIKYNGTNFVKACTCDYIWYLNTISNSTVCLTEDNDIRKYLENNCTIPS